MAARGALWILATTLGLAVGGVVFHFPGSYGGLAEWDVTATIFGAILGFITGVLVGLAQWAALTLGRREGFRLLLWMGIGVAVTHGLLDGGPNSIGILAVASLSGLAMAAAYAWSLRERRPIPIIAVGVAWAAGLAVVNWVAYSALPRMGIATEQTPAAWATAHAIEAMIVGVIWGVTTALVGVPEQLARPRTPTPDATLDPAASATP